MRAGILATLATTASATAELTTRRLQGAQMIGGRPPKEVEMALCDIGTVFAKLTEIKENGDCTSGCAGGTGVCPPNCECQDASNAPGPRAAAVKGIGGFGREAERAGGGAQGTRTRKTTAAPSAARCSSPSVRPPLPCALCNCADRRAARAQGTSAATCSRPPAWAAWTRCPSSVRRPPLRRHQPRSAHPDALPPDDHCLQTLYPPGMCGTFCNQHTYDCYVAEVQESCCDEEGQNCVAGVDIPRTCPVGCAIVFPEFLETCRDHVSAQEDLVEEDFEAFEEDCLSQDGLALVEYALSLVDSGCILDLSSPSGRRLQDSGYLTQWLDASTPSCSWDEIDDIAVDVDM